MGSRSGRSGGQGGGVGPAAAAAAQLLLLLLLHLRGEAVHAVGDAGGRLVVLLHLHLLRGRVPLLQQLLLLLLLRRRRWRRLCRATAGGPRGRGAGRGASLRWPRVPRGRGSKGRRSRPAGSCPARRPRHARAHPLAARPSWPGERLSGEWGVGSGVSGAAVDVDVDTDPEGTLQDEERLMAEKLAQFGKTHKGARARWSVKPNFPDVLVAEAFLKPKASMDATAFDWSVPKLHRIRAYCRETFGWTDAELDVQVDPVIERYASRNAQSRIDNYFISYHDDNRLSKIKSNRMRSAVEQITGKKTKLALPQKEPNVKKPRVSKTAAAKRAGDDGANAKES